MSQAISAEKFLGTPYFLKISCIHAESTALYLTVHLPFNNTVQVIIHRL